MEPTSIFKKGDAPDSGTDKSLRNLTKYKEIISTLTQKRSWLPSQPLHEYQGFWCYPTFLEGIMSAQEHFIAQPTDIFTCTHPKCGTTWLKSLCFAVLTRRNFSDSSSNPLLTESPHEIVPWIDFLASSGQTRDPELPLLATHIPYTSLPESIVESNCKIIYTCRDPKDVFISLWQFAGIVSGSRAEDFPLEEAYQQFCEGVHPYGPYWDHILGYWKAHLQFPDGVLFIKYEDLKNDTFSYVKRMAEFMGCPFSMEEESQGLVQKIVDLCSFESLSNLEVNKSKKRSSATGPFKLQYDAFFRKGKIGDWENYLTVDMAAQLDQITEQKLSGTGLSFPTSYNSPVS
ncbi:hypothetical protein P3X46_013681 [Hevea brasiliensis]|uniref:Sulfotransferase n=1 Tax=Hevea brasiliensis TaxID=3981 RepID=A0ABQ9M4A0_HEVBR|nr:flavonol sulfotransferase-like [Hevea brasiliensis]KAJ9175099.1 hypothetical protein P3X46_013681 [Hevea brasiliensis]